MSAGASQKILPRRTDPARDRRLMHFVRYLSLARAYVDGRCATEGLEWQRFEHICLRFCPAPRHHARLTVPVPRHAPLPATLISCSVLKEDPNFPWWHSALLSPYINDKVNSVSLCRLVRLIRPTLAVSRLRATRAVRLGALASTAPSGLCPMIPRH